MKTMFIGMFVGISNDFFDGFYLRRINDFIITKFGAV